MLTGFQGRRILLHFLIDTSPTFKLLLTFVELPNIIALVLQTLILGRKLQLPYLWYQASSAVHSNLVP